MVLCAYPWFRPPCPPWTLHIHPWPHPSHVELDGVVELPVALVLLPTSPLSSHMVWLSSLIFVAVSCLILFILLSSALSWVIGVMDVLIGACSDCIGPVSLG